MTLNGRTGPIVFAAVAAIRAHLHRCPRAGSEWYHVSTDPVLDVQIAVSGIRWEVAVLCGGPHGSQEICTVMGQLTPERDVQVSRMVASPVVTFWQTAVLAGLERIITQEWCVSA